MFSKTSNKSVIQLMNGGGDHTEPAVCAVCFGTGVEIVPGKGARICTKCRPEKDNRLLEAARIPLRFRSCSFDNYDPKNVSQQWAHNTGKRLVADYPVVNIGLLLMGTVGVGKTHLASAILLGLLEKGVPCLFYESGTLLKEIQDSYNPISKSSELRVLAPVYQAEVLVLDELGATIPTDWVRDTLYQIINRRYNDKRLTIFTTNYPDEISIEPGQERETLSRKSSRKSTRELTTLEERIGVPLRSRLHEMCLKVVIKGEDYRKSLDRRR